MFRVRLHLLPRDVHFRRTLNVVLSLLLAPELTPLSLRLRR
jgi:hypothetical protein